MQTTNITTLARAYRVSTRDIEKKLTKLGIKPSNEVLMPSGRRFVLYDQTAALEALEKDKQAQLAKAQEQTEEVVETPSVAQELAEVKALLTAVLDMLTKPETVN